MTQIIWNVITKWVCYVMEVGKGEREIKEKCHNKILFIFRLYLLWEKAVQSNYVRC